MANPTTAAEWKQAAANILEQSRKNAATVASLYLQRDNIQTQVDILVAQRDNPATDAFDRALLQNQIKDLKSQQISIDNQVGQISQQELQLSQEYNNALAQAAIAEQGPPNVNENTPPITDAPNQPNTEVVVEPVLPPQAQATISAANSQAAAEADNLATRDGLITPSVQQNIANDDAAAQVDNLATREGLITPSGQQTITNEASAAQVNDLAVRDGLITPQVQQSIADDTAYAQADKLAAQDGLITPSVANAIATGSSLGLQGKTIQAQAQATLQDVTNFQQAGDWRVRLKLAPSAKYLYKADDPGILLPLKQSDGVIFPYTPQVSVSYAAHYDATELTHSNYKIFQYKNSSVDQISITCD
jgi:hypothetical protein